MISLHYSPVPCDACGTSIDLHLGFYSMDVAPTPDPLAVTSYVVKLCARCKAGALHAAARFVAYQRRSRGVEPLWETAS